MTTFVMGFSLIVLCVSFFWLGSGWLFGKNKIGNMFAYARIGHAAIICNSSAFVLVGLKFIGQRGFSDDDVIILVSLLGSAIVFGIILGEVLYRKFAPQESGIVLLFNSILSNRAKMEMEKEVMEKEPNVEEHLESIPNRSPKFAGIKRSNT